MSQRFRKRNNLQRSVLAGAGSLLAPPLVLTGGWILYSAFGIDHALPIRKAIESEWATFMSDRSGLMTYYVDRHAEGRPLVLLHSINAAASSMEMRPLFESYRSSRPALALDLPGFGFSERSDRVYSPQLYADAILDFLDTQVGEPADVVALSLTSEFAARAALIAPDRFHSLALISPTGFSARQGARVSERASRSQKSPILYRLFAFPLWAQAFYDLIATRPSIDYFLQQSFAGPVDRALADYAYSTAHQPGARYAPLYFVSGQLFTPHARTRLYEPLQLPVLVLYNRDPFVRFDRLPDFMQEHKNWHSVRLVPTKGLPQFERLDETRAALNEFWQGEGA